MKLLQKYQSKNDQNFSNRVVMAPMTRSRAIDNIPNEIMAEYYGARSNAGLIITEGTAPSANGQGYPRIPSMYTDEQEEGWKKVTKAVHQNGGKIALQLMHTGRVAHPLNMPYKATMVAPSAIAVKGMKMYTDKEGNLDMPTPIAMTEKDIQQAIEEHIQAAERAMNAGFDFVEIHGANGYLNQQFINKSSNQRTDKWGGSIENRSRFLLTVTKGVADAIGRENVGVRLSPFGTNNDLASYHEIIPTYQYIIEQLDELKIGYLHLIRSAIPDQNENLLGLFRNSFSNTLILNGDFSKEEAEEFIQEGKTDLVSFGRPFIANPDLVYRFEIDADLNEFKEDLLYTPGPEGYTDYPTIREVEHYAS